MRDPVTVDTARVERAITELLTAIGEDPARDGLLEDAETGGPMYEELFAGFGENPADHLEVTFAAEHDEMVMVRDIPFASLCEHHLIPFIGRAHVAYIPGDDGRITGLSKLARLVDGFARRLQVQERMTTEIADAIEDALAPRGCWWWWTPSTCACRCGGEETGHLDRHLGGAGSVPQRRRRPGRRPCSSSAAADSALAAGARTRPAGLRCVPMPSRPARTVPW